MQPKSTTITKLTLCIILAAIAFAVYSNTLRNPFVYDDLVLIEGNAALEQSSSYRKLFTKEYFDISGERSYRPVATALSITDAVLGGRAPAIFRATSVAVHSTATAAAFLLALEAAGAVAAPFAAALLFAVHPLLTEAVNGSSFIEDPLSALFLFISLTLYIRYRKKGGAAKLAAAAITALAAMFAKESAAILLPLAILWEILYARRKNLTGGALPALAAITLATTAFLIIRFALMTNPASGASPVYPGGTLAGTIPMMAEAFLTYLRLFFMPARLSIEHCPTPHAYTDAIVIASALCHIALLAFAISLIRSARAAAFGIFFYLISLGPISNIVPFGAAMAERYMYLPAFGLCLAVASIFTDIFADTKGVSPKNSRLARVAGYGFLIAIAAMFASATIQRNTDWRSPLKLWEGAAATCPGNSRARGSYGRELLKAGRNTEALEQLHAAIQIDPRHYEPWLSLGAACINLRDLRCARYAYENALRVHPSNDVRYNLALMWMQAGQPARAIPYLVDALRQQPRWTAARYLLANSLLASGRTSEAVKEYGNVLAAEPDNINAMGNLGVALIESGDTRGAEKIFRSILSKDPQNKPARKNLERLATLSDNTSQRR